VAKPSIHRAQFAAMTIASVTPCSFSGYWATRTDSQQPHSWHYSIR